MTLVRNNPSGSNGADVTTSAPLTVVKAGTGTCKYTTATTFDRGNQVAIRMSSPLAADQSNIKLAATAAAAGSGQMYGLIEAWPTGGVQEFMTLMTASGNCVRQLVSTAGSVTVQNTAGTTVATLGTISLNTEYRFELDATPGTTTSNGSARARIYNDDDTLLYDSGALTAGNYGGGLATKTVSIVRAGDPATVTTTGFIINVSQLGIDTGATVPTITPVPHSYLRTTNDAAGATDAVVLQVEKVTDDPAGVDLTGTGADMAGITDAVTIVQGRSPADTAGATDAASWTADLQRTAGDTAAASDVVAVQRDSQRTVDDPAGLTDQAAVGRGGLHDEPAAVTDTVTVQQQLQRVVGDTAAATDQVTVTIAADRQPADVTAVTDQVTILQDLARQPADTAGASDEVTIEYFRAPPPFGLKLMHLTIQAGWAVTVESAANDTAPVKVYLRPRPAIHVVNGGQVSIPTGPLQVWWHDDGHVVLPPGGRVVTGRTVITV